MNYLLPIFVGVLLGSCSLSHPVKESSIDSFRSQSISGSETESEPGLLANAPTASRLLVLPFSISLQRHYLVKDPVFERSAYLPMNQTFADTITHWSEGSGYDSDILDMGDRASLFASQRVTSTSIRLLNKKNSITQMPPLPGLVKNLQAGKKQETASLIMAGSYIGHRKSAGQLLKETVTSGMRYVRNLGRKQLQRPVAGFGKLFVVVLEGGTGRVLWFSDAEADPGNAHRVLARVLSRFEKEDVERLGKSGAGKVLQAESSRQEHSRQER